MLVTFSTTAKSPPSWLRKQMLDLENWLKNENKVLLNRAVFKKHQVTPDNLPLPLETLRDF